MNIQLNGKSINKQNEDFVNNLNKIKDIETQLITEAKNFTDSDREDLKETLDNIENCISILNKSKPKLERYVKKLFDQKVTKVYWYIADDIDSLSKNYKKLEAMFESHIN